jgi:NCS1 family nucleobase:cation symporter-1
VVDYFLIKRQKVVISDLYVPNRNSRYFYTRGINLKAVSAFVPAAAFSIAVALVPAFSDIAPFAWYSGALIAGGLYWAVMGRRKETV